MTLSGLTMRWAMTNVTVLDQQQESGVEVKHLSGCFEVVTSLNAAGEPFFE